MGRRARAAPDEEAELTAPPRRAPDTEEPTRRFDEQMADSYPSVFVPPAYQPPPRRSRSPASARGRTSRPRLRRRRRPAPLRPTPTRISPTRGRPTAPSRVWGYRRSTRSSCPTSPSTSGWSRRIIELAMVPRERDAHALPRGAGARAATGHRRRVDALQLRRPRLGQRLRRHAVRHWPPSSSSSSPSSASGRASHTTSPPSTSPPAGSARRSLRRSRQSSVFSFQSEARASRSQRAARRQTDN